MSYGKTLGYLEIQSREVSKLAAVDMWLLQTGLTNWINVDHCKSLVDIARMTAFNSDC